MKKIVSIVRVEDGIGDAVKKTIKLLGGIEKYIREGDKYLLKPNLFITRTPEQGVTTDMRIVMTIADMLKKQGAEPIVGECPATASYTRPDIVFEGLGVRKLCEEAGVELNVLDREKPIKVENLNAEVIKELWFPELALKCDGIFNFPKLKTHQLTTLTCAVKNLLGLQQGGTKANFHVITKNDPEKFSRLLIDIYESIRNQIKLNIVDAIIGMEGEGPTTGDPIYLGLIIAGEDAVAVDFVASAVMGWDPMEVGTNLIASERGLGPSSLEDVEVVGLSIDNVIHPFRKPRIHLDGQTFIKVRMLIECDMNKCVGCGICAKICPGKAITLMGTPEIDYDLCIQCFCCIELCPNGALNAHNPLKIPPKPEEGFHWR